MVVSENQMLLTSTGALVKAKNSKGSNIFWWDNNTYKTNLIKEVVPVDNSVHKFISAQGRLIECLYDTDFLGYDSSKKFTEKKLVNYSKFKDLAFISKPGTHFKTTVAVLGHLDIFGKLKYSTEELNLLKLSLYIYQDKRPNPYTKVGVPYSLSKLTKADLNYILKPFLENNKLRNLSTAGKDTLIFLLSRLGIQANGHSLHTPLEESGTLRIKRHSTEPVRFENLRYSGPSSNKAVQLTTENQTNNLLIGGFLCQTPHN